MRTVKMLIGLLVFIHAGCRYSITATKIPANEIRGIKFQISFPTLTEDGRFIVIKDSQYISCYLDFVIYDFPYIKEFSSNVFDKDGNLFKSKLIKTELNLQRFIYRKGKSYGYYFDSLQDKTGMKHPVDSFLNGRFRINDSLLFSVNDSLLNKTSEKEGIEKEVYVRVRKTDKWDCDTNTLFFSDQFKHVEFSFSRALDSRGMKLFKVHQISNGNPYSEMPFFRQRREVLMEIKNNPVKDKREIIDFINRVVEKESL